MSDRYATWAEREPERCQGCEDAPVGQHTGPHDWERPWLRSVDEVFTSYDLEKEAQDKNAPAEGEPHVHEFEETYVCRCGEFYMKDGR